MHAIKKELKSQFGDQRNYYIDDVLNCKFIFFNALNEKKIGNYWPEQDIMQMGTNLSCKAVLELL